MDPFTHAASGALLMLALPNRPLCRSAVPLAALAAMSPDIDVFFAATPLQFLLLHRGITHSLFFAPLLALVLALLAFPLWRASTQKRWSLPKVWLLMLGLVLLHIWLDCITTYGTMIFLPFSQLRVRLNAVFIVDFLLLLPMLWAIFCWRQRPARLRLTLAWLFVYPVLAIALNAYHTKAVTAHLAAQKRNVEQVTLLPDALAPFFWRALYAENTPEGPLIHSQGLDCLGRAHGAETTDAAMPKRCKANLMQQSAMAKRFLEFTHLPIVAPLADPELLPPQREQNEAVTYMQARDLRFGTNLDFVHNIMNLRSNGGTPFSMLLELAQAEDAPPVQQGGVAPCTQLRRVALYFPNQSKRISWQSPRPPQEPPFWLWLVGLH